MPVSGASCVMPLERVEAAGFGFVPCGKEKSALGAAGGSQSTALRPRSRQAVQSLPWGHGDPAGSEIDPKVIQIKKQS